ncbi:MAG: DNA-binding protein [Clostridia bacterium]|nr:DNA-binding protein [Clostridia bacterium]
MEYKRYGDKIFLRLNKGEEIVESVRAAASAENITAGSLSGIGATDDFTVGVFDINKKAYEEFSFSGNHEITALVGNISFADGKPYVHLHITCAGKGGNVVGGHLLKAVVSLTAEIVIDTANGWVGREKDNALGINLWKF